MIRKTEPADAGAIAEIYNEYILHSTASFETEPLDEGEMLTRIAGITNRFPCFVYETDGRIAGYCYAHPWKEKAAYCHTLETTVYISPACQGMGIGRELMQKLIEACREKGFHTLIACITEGNEASCALHERLGFRQASHFREVGEKFGRWLGVVDYELTINP